jgi:cell division protein FtsN
MKKLIAVIFSLFVTTAVFAQSQTAEDYFHSGAQSFIQSDLQAAIDQVQTGLNQYPDNPKLNALMQKLLEEQKKQQQQQNQDQQQQNQQNQQQDQEQQNQEEQQEQENQEQEQGEEQQEQDPQEMNPEDLNSQQISKEDAEKILQALAQKEKELLKEFKKKKSDGSAKHDKDW